MKHSLLRLIYVCLFLQHEAKYFINVYKNLQSLDEPHDASSSESIDENPNAIINYRSQELRAFGTERERRDQRRNARNAV